MLVDLVQVTTRDGVRLHGALELPPDHAPPPRPAGHDVLGGVDAWLCVHGTGSNFYASSTLSGLAPKLLAEGAAVLRVNTRGHDVICTGPAAGGRSLLGSAYERVDEAPLDLRAWLALLAERGMRRVALLGHSMGAIKAILTLAAEEPPPVAAMVAASPPRLSHALFLASAAGEAFRRTFDAAEALVRDGRGGEIVMSSYPLPLAISAASYVDRYGPEEKYDVLRHLPRLRVPTLVTYGSAELQYHDAFRGMPEAVMAAAGDAGRLEVAVIAGADHNYTACHDSLVGVIGRWLRRHAAARAD